MSKKPKSLVEQALDDPKGFDYTAAVIKLGIDESDDLTIAFCAGLRRGRKLAKDRWISLTEDDVASWELPNRPTLFEFAKFVEAKIKDKNL